LTLAACQAEDLEIDLSQADILAAFAGTDVIVEFEAEVGEKFTKVDEEKRANIDRVVSELKSFIPGVEIDVDYNDDGYMIEIEGEIIVSSDVLRQGAPWYVAVEDTGYEGFMRVSLKTSGTFAAFQDRMKNINFMLSPDEFQPVEFDLRLTGGTLMFAGARLDGRPSGPTVMTAKQRLKLSFSEGIWSDTAAGFLFKPD